MINTALVTKAIKSEIGAANITPSTPINIGNITSNGSRKITCFTRESNAPFTAFPIAWKKVVVAICIPLRKVKKRNTRRYFVPKSKYKSLPSPNSEISGRGASMNNKKAKSEKIKEEMTASFSASLTLL